MQPDNSAVQIQNVRNSDVANFLNALEIDEVITGTIEYSAGPFGQYSAFPVFPFKTIKKEPPQILAFTVAQLSGDTQLNPLPNIGFYDYDGSGNIQTSDYTLATASNEAVNVSSELPFSATPDPVNILVYVLRNKVKRQSITADAVQ